MPARTIKAYFAYGAASPSLRLAEQAAHGLSRLCLGQRPWSA